MIRPLYPNPACWNDRRTSERRARLFDRDCEGEAVLELAGEDADRIARLIGSGLVNNQPTEALRLRLLNAVAERHRGSREEGEKIVASILAELSS
jgi:hypothetical protein